MGILLAIALTGGLMAGIMNPSKPKEVVKPAEPEAKAEYVLESSVK